MDPSCGQRRSQRCVSLPPAAPLRVKHQNAGVRAPPVSCEGSALAPIIARAVQAGMLHSRTPPTSVSQVARDSCGKRSPPEAYRSGAARAHDLRPCVTDPAPLTVNARLNCAPLAAGFFLGGDQRGTADPARAPTNDFAPKRLNFDTHDFLASATKNNRINLRGRPCARSHVRGLQGFLHCPPACARSCCCSQKWRLGVPSLRPAPLPSDPATQDWLPMPDQLAALPNADGEA